MFKKIMIGIFCFQFFTTSTFAQAYCVMTGNDLEVVAENNMHHQQSVASISKIMTAVVAIENGNLEEQWEVSDEILKVDGSSIYLRKGQKVSLRSLLYGLMLRSGNDAAVEIAKHVGKEIPKFVEMMNEKAQKIGMKNTIFTNPSGLDDYDQGNLSTPYDMALLMSYAMKNPVFREIASAKHYDSEWRHHWQNKNKLLFEYEKATGGKTGFTKKAGRTLVTSAKDKNLETIVVTFNVANDFKFHKQQHENVFQNYDSVLIMPAGSYFVQGKEFLFLNPFYVKKAKTEKILNITSKIENHQLKIEVQFDKRTQVFTFDIKQKQNMKDGWLL